MFSAMQQKIYAYENTPKVRQQQNFCKKFNKKVA